MTSGIIAAICAFLLVVVLWLYVSYSGFKRMKNNAGEVFRAMEMCYEIRRKTADSFTKLVKNYIKGEGEAVKALENAVKKAREGQLPAEVVAAEAEVMEAIIRLTEICEEYDDFAESKRFFKIKEDLAKDDRNIATTIRIYNKIAGTYNQKVTGIMTKIPAKLFGFEQLPLI